MNAVEIRHWLVTRVAAMLQADPATIDDRESFDSFGLSSTGAVALSGELEQLLGRTLSPTLVYEYPSIAALAQFLGGDGGAARHEPSPDTKGADRDGLIAIVGIGCRFPGADGPDAYWQLLRGGIDRIREVPADRWDARAVYHPDPSVPGKTVTRWGGFLDQIDRFDPFFFGISPGEAERMDPQQRLLLELAYESFEDAGYTMERLAGSRTGVFIGISINESSFGQVGRHEAITGHSATGNALSIAANRISYFFDLHGPSMAIDTACSSSLTAVHLACTGLRTGECDLAVAGGVNIVLSPAHSIAFTKAGVLAPDGRCKVFDARADGYVRGEGGGVVVLKPLARALADRDPIYAVIRGSAIRQDGRTNGLMAPNGEAQEAVLRDAYRNAEVSPARVQYVEAHGTGTLLGDSIEAHALGAVLGPNRANGPCAIGSVKSNFGHLEAAAGVAGLIKVALALKHRVVPPSLHFVTPNPHVPFGELKLQVQHTCTPWPDHTDSAVAGVSSFGFGGTNVHVVMEEARQAERQRADSQHGREVPEVLPLSAHSPAALTALVHAYRGILSVEPPDVALHDLCATAARRRNHLDHRVAVVARSPQELIAGLDDFLNGVSQPDVVAGRRSGVGAGRIAFVFSGQGSQWHGMGRELLRRDPGFRASLERCEVALRPHVDWSLFDQLERDADQSRLAEIDVVQPTLFALQFALANLWRSWGVEPDAVVGHSMGEVAAACVAGILTLEDGARVICARSRLLRRLSGRGGMAVVGLATDETERYLTNHRGQLAIAASNSPRSTVVSGDLAALRDLGATLERDGIFCSPVNVDVASHSSQTAPLGDELRQCLQGMEPRPGSVPFVSTVPGADPDVPLDADYWARNLTEPVQFTGAIAELVRGGHATFIEISPHPVLQSSVQQGLIHLGAQGAVLSSTRRDESERHGMLVSLAALYASGHSIAWNDVYSPIEHQVSLPSYPWQRERYWLEAAGIASEWPERSGPNDRRAHPLLGRRVALAHDPGTCIWQSDWDSDRAIFLRDHRVNGQVVVPASAFIELARAAAVAAGIPDNHVLVDLVLRRSLMLPAGERRTVQVALVPDKDQDTISFSMHSRPVAAGDAEWTLHATAAFAIERPDEVTPRPDLAMLRQSLSDAIRPDELYQALAARGLEYGPTLRGIQQVWGGNGEALGRVVLSETLRHEIDTYQIHPAILDAALQVLAATADIATGSGADDATYVPVGCRRLRFNQRAGDALWSHAVLRSGSIPGASEIVADVQLLDDSGRAIAELTGLRLARLALERRPEVVGDRHTWLYRVRWQPAAWPATTPSEVPDGVASNRWLILADRHGIADALRQRLEARGQCCALLQWNDAFDIPVEATDATRRERDAAVRNAIRAQLATERSSLRGVIHLWSADAEPAARVSAASLHAAQAPGCDAVLHLVQGLVRHSGSLGMPQVWLVTRGVQPVLPEDMPAVTQAPVWGLGRTIGFELPELRCTMVDLDPALDASAASGLLLRQLESSDTEDQVAFRAGHRWVPRLSPFTPSRAAQPGSDAGPVALRSDGSYLITGGLGGLGLAVADWMVEQGAGHLVLVGRGEPAPATAAAVDRLRQLGADVTVLRADVAVAADLAAVMERIREGGAPLRGVVHAAGVLDNASVIDLDAERMAKVLAPKVAGAWHLHAATASDPLDFFVLFSSAVSVLGSPGQGNYAAANTFLDVLAHYRHRLGLPATSINWGPWVDIGLVASGEFLPASRRSGSHGVKGITPARGLAALGRVLQDASAQVTVLPFDIASLLELYPSAARIPFFADVGGTDTHVSRLYARPELRQEYIAPRNDIERKLVELWRQTLRIDRVGVRDSFFELGGDSVLAAQIVTSAHKTFGVGIDLREAFAAFTIEHLGTRIESSLVARIAAMSESEAQRLLEE